MTTTAITHTKDTMTMTEQTGRPSTGRRKKRHVAKGTRIAAAGIGTATALGLIGVMADGRTTDEPTTDTQTITVPWVDAMPLIGHLSESPASGVITIGGTETRPPLRIVIHRLGTDDDDDVSGRPVLRRAPDRSDSHRASTHGSD